MAFLPLVTGVPLYFGSCRRVGRMKYHCKAVGPLPHAAHEDRREAVKSMLGQLNRELEKVIREHPEQYLWAHRRWRADEVLPR